MGTNVIDPGTLNIALLVTRVVFGLLMAAHGAQKLLGWFGGYGLKATGEFMTSLGFRQGRAAAAAASGIEVASGLLVAFGLLGPVGPALMLSVMVVAAITVHWRNGLFAATNGIEVTLLFGTAGFALALAGFGQYSMDAILGFANMWSTEMRWVVLAIAVTGALANVGLSRASRPAAK